MIQFIILICTIVGVGIYFATDLTAMKVLSGTLSTIIGLLISCIRIR